MKHVFLILLVLVYFCFHFSQCTVTEENWRSNINYTRQSHADAVKVRKRRDFGIIGIIIMAIEIGISLAGTTVSALMAPGFRVSCSGSVINYSKWTLHLLYCNVPKGKMNVGMRPVHPGTIEGFASHKTAYSATGNRVKCTYAVFPARSNASTTYIHIMYNLPYDGNLYSNQLSLAVCSGDKCLKLTADDMLDKEYDFMRRKSYKDSTEDIFLCGSLLCVSGNMGTSHRSTIKISVFPVHYWDLSGKVLKKARENKITQDDYTEFLKVEKKIEQNSADVRIEPLRICVFISFYFLLFIFWN